MRRYEERNILINAAIEQVAEPDFLIAWLLKSRLAPAFDSFAGNAKIELMNKRIFNFWLIFVVALIAFGWMIAELFRVNSFLK